MPASDLAGEKINGEYIHRTNFAGLNKYGEIVSFGGEAPKGTGFVQIYSGNIGFAARKADGSITSWGSAQKAPSGSGFTRIYSNTNSFAATKKTGEVHIWGASESDSKIYNFDGIARLEANDRNFAVIDSKGRLRSFGINQNPISPAGNFKDVVASRNLLLQ